MRHSPPAPRLFTALLAALLAPAAAAQTLPPGDFDYDALTEELPITAPLLAPRLTFGPPEGPVTTVYGQLNLAYQGFDDGRETTANLVDNGNWNSRLGLTQTHPLAEGTLRFRFETGLTLRNSGMVSQTETPDWSDWQQTLLRWFELAYDAEYGTLSFGQGSSASDGTAGLDDSGTFVAGATNATDGFGSFRFRAADGRLTDVTIGQVNNAFNGARRFRLRYDTPVLQGFMLSASTGENILTEGDDNLYSDIALRWTGDLADLSVRSAIGYQWIDMPGGALTRRLAASLSLVHTPTGLNLAISTGQQIDGARYVWTRAGWQTNLIAAGPTALSVDYYDGQDFLTEGAHTRNYGLYAVQSFDAASLDLYAGLRRFTYSDPSATRYEPADSLLIGARWFF